MHFFLIEKSPNRIERHDRVFVKGYFLSNRSQSKYKETQS
jgi:hypothetical protein